MGSKQVQLANDIIGEIIQKVGKQEYASKSYSNPLADLKRDFINSATKIEEIYVERALAQEPDQTGVDTLRRVAQDIKTKYRQENYSKCYTISIQDNEVKEGFTSQAGIQKLADKKIEALNRGISVDEYKKMEETINLIPSLTNIKKTTISAITDNTGVLGLLEKIEEDSDMMTFSSKDFNSTFECDTPKDRQIIITTPQVYARIKVELAKIYNCSLIDLKKRVRLIKEFKDSKVKLLLVDKEILRIHPTLYNHETQRNAKGMFTNHHVNVSYIMAVSEMYNGVVYSTGA